MGRVPSVEDRKRDFTRLMQANGARQVDDLNDPRAGPTETVAFEKLGRFYIYGPVVNGKRKRLAYI